MASRIAAMGGPLAVLRDAGLQLAQFQSAASAAASRGAPKPAGASQFQAMLTSPPPAGSGPGFASPDQSALTSSNLGGGIGSSAGAAGVQVGGGTLASSIFYGVGGSYGGTTFVPGISPVRIYLFAQCAQPALAATWPGCWCAVCFVDVIPATLSLRGQVRQALQHRGGRSLFHSTDAWLTQRLVNDYAIVANLVATDAQRKAWAASQRLEARQAEAAYVNARLAATATVVAQDAAATQALLYAQRLKTKQDLAATVYAQHNPNILPALAAVNAATSGGTVVVASGGGGATVISG